jgi:hypothetical protein
MIPTLKSRLRHIYFQERDPHTSRQILRRIYREDGGYDSLGQFFLAWSTNPDALRHESEKFFRSLINRDPMEFFSGDEGDSPFLKELENRRVFAAFLSELNATAQRRFKDRTSAGRISVDELRRYEEWTTALRNQYVFLETLNLSPRLLTENLYQEMASAL